MGTNMTETDAKLWSIEFQTLDYDMGAGFFSNCTHIRLMYL